MPKVEAAPDLVDERCWIHLQVMVGEGEDSPTQFHELAVAGPVPGPVRPRRVVAVAVGLDGKPGADVRHVEVGHVSARELHGVLELRLGKPRSYQGLSDSLLEPALRLPGNLRSSRNEVREVPDALAPSRSEEAQSLFEV